MLERFSSESCPMNKKNLEMIKEINDLCDEIVAEVSVCYDIDELRDVTEGYRPRLLSAIQRLIDYNAVDYIVMDAATSHIITDPQLPDWYFAVSNPRHMAWTDNELKKELAEKGFVSHSMRNEGRFDE